MLPNPDAIVERLREFQRRIRDVVVRSREAVDLHAVSHQSSADTIYKLDLLIEPVIEEFCEEWGRRTTPMVVVAEGIEPESGRVFPAGASEADAPIRIIMDPVDGTRGLMYDKRAAWSLAGAARNKGAATRLSDIEVAVMTELPTSKMAWGDVLWAVKGQGARGVRETVDANAERGTGNWDRRPSGGTTSAQGFARVSNFFRGTKERASR